MVSRFQLAGGSIPPLGRGLANHVKRFVAPSRPDRFYRLRSRPRVPSQRPDRVADDDRVEHDELRLRDTKTGARAVPLSPMAKQVLTALPRRPDNSQVFPGRARGTRLRILNASWQVVRSKDVRLHDLRHSSTIYQRYPAPASSSTDDKPSFPSGCLNPLPKFAEAIRNRICLSRRQLLPPMPPGPPSTCGWGSASHPTRPRRRSARHCAASVSNRQGTWHPAPMRIRATTGSSAPG